MGIRFLIWDEPKSCDISGVIPDLTNEIVRKHKMIISWKGTFIDIYLYFWYIFIYLSHETIIYFMRKGWYFYFISEKKLPHWGRLTNIVWIECYSNLYQMILSISTITKVKYLLNAKYPWDEEEELGYLCHNI